MDALQVVRDVRGRVPTKAARHGFLLGAPPDRKRPGDAAVAPA
jgi:hypothetical protein